MIVIKGGKYQAIKAEDLKPGETITVADPQLPTASYNQVQVAELMNQAYSAGYDKCNDDNCDDMPR